MIGRRALRRLVRQLEDACAGDQERIALVELDWQVLAAAYEGEPAAAATVERAIGGFHAVFLAPIALPCAAWVEAFG